MCGIIGFTGDRKAIPILLEGLEALEYRGYDSAGIAICREDDKIHVAKAKGRLENLRQEISVKSLSDNGCGIGHTRWATHGEPSARNAHPHGTEHLILVHNGIIENYAELGEQLKKVGYSFESETDTEVAAKLIDNIYINKKDPVESIFEAVKYMRGSFAFGIIFRENPHVVYAIRRDSPLLVAKAENGNLIASDVSAILPHTKQYYRLEENIVAILKKDNISFLNEKKEAVYPPEERIEWNVEQAQKNGYPHFMIKEIHEEPEAIRKTLSPCLENSLPHFGIDLLDTDAIQKFRAIHIVACGTAMHAGLIGKYIIEKMARISVHVDIASEFRYRDPILHPSDLVILLSQSGETADTLAALRHAKLRGITTLAIVNVMGSSAAREADHALYTRAGPEIAVASTKAYSVQCALLYLLAIRLGLIHNTLPPHEARELCCDLITSVPDSIETILARSPQIARCARRIMTADHLFFIGRGRDHSIAAEASLKLKEISYIHSEAYAAGELKHGTISLITDGTPVIALLTESALCEKTISAIREVIARGAQVLAICDESLAQHFEVPCHARIDIPHIREDLSLFPTATAVQLLAYHVATAKNLDVDKPRNLAKSVTVE